MKLAQSVRIGAWLMVTLNLLMAFGSIWIFMRMAPAIEVIIDRNVNSLEACEQMLASLAALSDDAQSAMQYQAAFSLALDRARHNITEKAEPEALKTIQDVYEQAFHNDAEARSKCTQAIVWLSRINREAMITADRKAQRIGNAGAWGVVFMAASVFFAGMVFIRSLTRNLVRPLDEIHEVITAHLNGDVMRRCTGPDLPKDARTVFSGINEFLDSCRPSLSLRKTM